MPVPTAPVYPETIARTDCDSREHPSHVTIELFQGKYRVHNYFWDGVKYQSNTVGARYGYLSLAAARKAYFRQIGKNKENWLRQEDRKREVAAMIQALTPTPAPKPRIRLMAIARQID
jgi:hypothetical protein